MGRIYRLRRGDTLLSFGDAIADVPICGVRLADAQRAAAAENAVEIADVSSEDEITDARYLVFEEDIYFTPAFLKRALTASLARTRDAKVCVPRSPFNDSVVLPTGPVPDHRWPLGMILRVRDGAANGSAERGPEPEEIEVEQEVFEGAPTGLPPSVVPPGSFRIDISDCFAAPVPTPFHLLHVNVAALLSRFAASRRRWPDWLLSRFAPPRSPRFYAGLRRANRIGSDCRIHPTAVVEGATLGDGVTVGAHAVVRLAQVGAGSTIEDQASVTLSVLGERNYVANKNHIAFCLSYDDVFAIHGPYQFSVFGRGSAVFAVIACDVRLDHRTITMPLADGVVDSNRQLLGNVYGHHAHVGGGNIIAPGRIVPNGLHVPPPDTIHYAFDGPEEADA